MIQPRPYSFSKQELEVFLEYDAKNGVFYRKKTNNKYRVGEVMGCQKANGYVYVGVFKKHILAHRLVWFFEHGVWPSQVLDHIDGNKANNRIENLRLATYSQNSINRPVMSNSKTQLKGVWFNKKKNRYRAVIKCNHQRIHIGMFKTPEEAHAAYVAKAKELHQEFMRAN